MCVRERERVGGRKKRKGNDPIFDETIIVFMIDRVTLYLGSNVSV